MTAAHRRTTYRDVLGIPEFRALYVAGVVSNVGDQVARIALAILVLDRSRSPLYAALAYAVSYLPWVIGGPVLSPLADRLPRRRVMLGCDLVRAGIVAVMALPGMPLPALFALLFAASMLSPPFEAARAATVPDIVEGDGYVVASSLTNITTQLVFVAGFLMGGAIVAVLRPRGALVADALTFLVSAALLRSGVRGRPAAVAEGRPTLLADVVEGARVVFRDRLLRGIVLLAWAGAAFAVVPEGLAVSYVRARGGGPLEIGLLTAASPFGTVVGALVVGRFVAPPRRPRLMLPLAAATFVPLLATVAGPPIWLAAVLWALSGVGLAYQLPANATFVAALPPHARGRAFGLAQSGLQVGQGLSLAGAGALAEVLPIHTVVALAGLGGLTAVAVLASGWPRHEMAGVLAPAAAGPAPQPESAPAVAEPAVVEPAVVEPAVVEPAVGVAPEWAPEPAVATPGREPAATPEPAPASTAVEPVPLAGPAGAFDRTGTYLIRPRPRRLVVRLVPLDGGQAAASSPDGAGDTGSPAARDGGTAGRR